MGSIYMHLLGFDFWVIFLLYHHWTTIWDICLELFPIILIKSKFRGAEVMHIDGYFRLICQKIVHVCLGWSFNDP